MAGLPRLRSWRQVPACGVHRTGLGRQHQRRRRCPSPQAEADIILLTQHYYRANGQAATSTLGPPAHSRTPTCPRRCRHSSAAASANQIPGGTAWRRPTRSTTAAPPTSATPIGTALWAIDFLFTNAQNGSTGVNFHGGGDSTGYTPIADSGDAVVDVRPEYYGISLFTLAAHGTLLTTAVTAPGIACSAYAVAVSDGSTNLVFVNKDAANSAQVTVVFGKPCTPGHPHHPDRHLAVGQQRTAAERRRHRHGRPTGIPALPRPSP